MQIIDNFLSDFNFKIITCQFLNNKHFTWNFNPILGGEYNIFYPNEKEPFQFTHCLYEKFSPTSEHFKYINPFIKKLNPKALIRVKLNLTTRSENIIKDKFHNDQNFAHKVAIFYLNTNNGFTLFEDGNKVNSVENRMLIFDGSLRHLGTNCTDKQRRVVINFNYL